LEKKPSNRKSDHDTSKFTKNREKMSKKYPNEMEKNSYKPRRNLLGEEPAGNGGQGLKKKLSIN